jgi:hypothetical protein
LAPLKRVAINLRGSAPRARAIAMNSTTSIRRSPPSYLATKDCGFFVRGRLHALRELHNDAKHNPSKPVRLKIASDRLRDCRSALADLIAAAPGQVRAAVDTAVSRLLWISGYDHHTGGCTSVYVSLPLPHDVFATHVDVFWLHHASWEQLKADLLSTGNFFYGATHFEPDAFARFNEDDFINAGVWDGDYRLLVAILARHEHRPLKDQLISNLRRDHMFISVLSAIILAGVDVVTTTSRVLDERCRMPSFAKPTQSMPCLMSGPGCVTRPTHSAK